MNDVIYGLECLINVYGATLFIKMVIILIGLYRYFGDDYDETVGTVVGYKENYAGRKWDIISKDWIYKYSYSMMVDYVVDDKKYQYIEKIGHMGFYVKKKNGSRVKVLYNKNNPIDSEIKYSFKIEIIIFCILLIISLILRG